MPGGVGRRFIPLAFCLFLFAQGSPAQSQVLVYPAAGNLRAEQGTIEMVFRFEEEPDPGGARALHYFPFFFISVDGEVQRRVSFTYQTIWSTNHMHFFFSSLGPLLGTWVGNPYVTTVEQGQVVKPGVNVPLWLPRMHKGDWHHVAITWTHGLEKPVVAVYLDGSQAIRSLELPAVWWADMEATTLELMSAPYHDDIAVDELRISDMARSPLQITNSVAQGALARDEHTLLLDHFDRIESNAAARAEQTVAEQIAGYHGERGGTLPSKCYELVDGKFGKALRLTAVPR